jgi:hypothetical protein
VFSEEITNPLEVLCLLNDLATAKSPLPLAYGFTGRKNTRLRLFSSPFGADNTADEAAGKRNSCGVDEGFEASELDLA